ncbi:YbhB/YbcL family Raf kinase inhibitor-like protein [Streptomyces fodineus]|uniref:YbhB/YbcL family Raf kinase inhibitor-like protein n=1 Tax=Streptomyces fodineus TaxID=1904616 RepID=UPI0009A12705|nr:YbhB/YbcL family Raf kinase inhibitor-like protein [Streptomyces fodineus]
MRRSWVIALAATAAVTGCGDGGGRAAAPSPTAARRLTVTSSAYADGGTVPRRDTCDGAGLSPPLALTGVPAHTAALALLLRDRDAPHGTFTHWLVWDIDPHTTRLPAGEHPRGATEGRNDFGKTGYSGPCPPRGDRPHRYVLTVYAVDRRLSLAADASSADLLRSLSGHTLAVGTLTGRYGRG